MEWVDAKDVSEGLRLHPDQMAKDRAVIEAAWPELHREVTWRPVGTKVGVVSKWDVGSKEQRNLSGTLLGAWRKILSESPVWYDSDEIYRVLDGLGMNECRALLLVGTDAIRGWQETLLPQELWGRWGIWNERWMVMPVQDPVTLSKGSAGKWGEDVKRFFEGYVSGVGTWGLSGKCVRGTCGNALWKYDRDGIAWCERHWTERYPEVKVVKNKALRQAIEQRMVL